MQKSGYKQRQEARIYKIQVILAVILSFLVVLLGATNLIELIIFK